MPWIYKPIEYIVSKKEWLLIRVGLSTSGYKPIEYIVSKKEWLLIRVGLSTSGYKPIEYIVSKKDLVTDTGRSIYEWIQAN